jgi:alpha-amylase
MKNLKKISQVFLVTLFVLTGCKSKTPKTYEFDKNVTNETGDVYYEIFVGSFCDSNGDGVGDLKGITEKIPYLKDLGIGGIWLTPIHPTGSYHGYDVEDYVAINPKFGTIEDFDELIEKANDSNIDIILDLVINHSSNRHPWFIEGKENFTKPSYDPNNNDDKANYYNFYYESGEVNYEAVFDRSMPDLNLANPRVKEEISAIMEFWFDHGVKGFRLDAAPHYFDSPVARTKLPAGVSVLEANNEFLNFLKTEANKFREDNYFVAEAWKNLPEQVSPYYRSGIDSFFNFAGSDTNGYIISSVVTKNATGLGRRISEVNSLNKSEFEDALTAHFLTNHDMDRSAPMWMIDEEQSKAKLGASIYMLQPGRPFIYYGEEIGLKGSRGGANTDANRRLAMQWQRANDTMRPKNPKGTTYDMSYQIKDGVKEFLEEPFSLLNHYKKVINVRNKYPFINYASVEDIEVHFVKGTVTLLKITGRNNEVIYVMHNLDEETKEVDFAKHGLKDLEIADDIFTTQVRSKIKGNTIHIAPYSTLVLKEK